MRPSQSPTFYNLSRYLQEQGWVSTRFDWLANFSEKNFQFDAMAAEQLEFKHLLANLVNEYCKELMPETYIIDDDNWPLILNILADNYYRENNLALDEVDNLIWILKPSKLNNGKHIKIFQNIHAIERHYLSSNRLGGEHVLQRYVTQPHLLKGHKYSIRMFVIVTNNIGVYLYPQGYINVSLLPYNPIDFNDLNTHLTNEHLKDDEVNVVQIPTQRLDIFHLFSLERLCSYIYLLFIFFIQLESLFYYIQIKSYVAVYFIHY
jgi:tubulin--tyrosine ligase